MKSQKFGSLVNIQLIFGLIRAKKIDIRNKYLVVIHCPFCPELNEMRQEQHLYYYSPYRMSVSVLFTHLSV